ncbi:MAG: MshA biogenesis protein MshI-2 [uncultured bacterium]|nr:MAG: MshA biogenesis protein MshI-2 [uncultured bacterium]
MLRQEINLYQFLEKPRTSSSFLSWKALWLSNLFFVGFLFLIYLYSLWDIHSLKVQKDAASYQATKLEKTFYQIKNTYPQLFFSQDAALTVNQFKQKIADQEKMLQMLAAQHFFSEDLLALSRIIAPQVWLTDILMVKGGQEITLKGNSLSRQDVHVFLKNLSQEKIFSGFNLNVNSIEGSNKDDLNKNVKFELTMIKQDNYE